MFCTTSQARKLCRGMLREVQTADDQSTSWISPRRNPPRSITIKRGQCCILWNSKS
ncbi:unnamed protein product [Brassica oleracea]